MIWLYLERFTWEEHSHSRDYFCMQIYVDCSLIGASFKGNVNICYKFTLKTSITVRVMLHFLNRIASLT